MNTDNPQALPQDDDLKAPDNLDVEAPDEKLKRIQREGEINKVAPEPQTNIGPDTTGAGQPTSQPVNQGQSLPAAQIPVEQKFAGTSDQFYDPKAAENAVASKDRANRGGQKADF